MRILQMAPYFPPYVGGQERFVYNLSRELVGYGHEVMVLTSNVPNSAKCEEVEGIRVMRHTCVLRVLRNPITPGLAIPRKYLTRFDIIHAHNEHSFASNVAVLYKHALHKPLVITCHGQLVFETLVADTFRRLYWRTIGRMVLTLASRITVATQSEKERLVAGLDIDAGKVEVLPVGVDLEEWDSFAKDRVNEFLGKHNLCGSKIVLVATQLIKRKGIQYLIRAMPEIAKEYPQVMCAIAGTGDYAGELRDLVIKHHLEERVRFLGVLGRHDLALAYEAADVFVLPSLSEGQPTCILEAWAFSKPVIATRIEGVVDYYDGVACLVEAGDAKGLASAVIRVLSDMSYAQILGRKGRQLVESSFSWERIGARFVSLYENVLAAECTRHDSARGTAVIRGQER